MLRHKRPLRIAFFALFPIALVSGLLLELRSQRRTFEQNYGVTGNRQQAISAAHQFLRQKGVDPTGWRTYCAAIINENLYRYLDANPGVVSDRIRKLAPPVSVRVMVESPDNQRRVFVFLALDNRVLGYDTRAVSMQAASPDTSDQGSLLVASDIVASDPDLASIFKDTKPEVTTLEKNAGVVARRYTWRSPFPGLRDVDMELTATIRNGRIGSRLLKSNVDDAVVAHLNRKAWLLRIFGICYVTFLSLAALYGIYSYVRRAIQKEVSHSRTALLALLVAICFFCVLTSVRDDMILQQPNADRSFPIAFVFALLGLFTSAGGILVGLGYGSGEGDVREAYPGKLTSLDALVTGKLFSKNVGRSIVIGAVFASWLLLLHGLLMNTLSAEQSRSSLNILKFPYMSAPWLSFIAVEPATAILYAVAGLLLPLAFLQRFVTNRNYRAGLLILFATFVVSGAASTHPSFAAFTIAAGVSVTGLLVPFFLFDLLTAMVALICFSLISQAASVTVMLPAWTRFAIAMGGLAAITVMVEILAWRKGRAYSEEEVRPTYARHIAERQELQAEVSAAREAQLRLLPHQSPEVPGLSIYASCLPAKVVGGDFYDFFPLSDQRLGIFIAEGGNRGLASALSIALAKGYLMHTAHGAYSPTEVILRLEATLGSILEAGVSHTTVAYAIVDARRRTLRYARTGVYPRIVVPGAGRSALYEREIQVPNHQWAVHEGSLDLKIGDSIVFYTDGIARRIAARSSLLQEDWMRQLDFEGHFDARAAHHHLLSAIDAGSLPERHNLEDDLTAIVIRCTRTDAVFIEGVA